MVSVDVSGCDEEVFKSADDCGTSVLVGGDLLRLHHLQPQKRWATGPRSCWSNRRAHIVFHKEYHREGSAGTALASSSQKERRLLTLRGPALTRPHPRSRRRYVGRALISMPSSTMCWDSPAMNLQAEGKVGALLKPLQILTGRGADVGLNMDQVRSRVGHISRGNYSRFS